MPQENAPSNEMAIILPSCAWSPPGASLPARSRYWRSCPGLPWAAGFAPAFPRPAAIGWRSDVCARDRGFRGEKGLPPGAGHGGGGSRPRDGFSEGGSSTICVEGEGLSWIEMRVTPRIRRVPIRMGFPFILARETGFPSIIVYQTHQFELATSRVVIPREPAPRLSARREDRYPLLAVGDRLLGGPSRDGPVGTSGRPRSAVRGDPARPSRACAAKREFDDRAPSRSGGALLSGETGALRRTVETLLGEGSNQDQGPRVVVPHAGYIYSGATAAAVYRLIEIPRRVVIVGPNHTGLGDPIAVMGEGEWAYPGGHMPLDAGLAAALKAEVGAVRFDDRAHRESTPLECRSRFSTP